MERILSKASLINARKVFKPINDSMINDGVDKLRTQAVETKAQYLVEKFQSPDSYKFYCKVAYNIPSGMIDKLVATAFERGRNPAAYFGKIAHKEMKDA